MSTITGSYARSFWRSSASSWAAGISSRASSACAAPTSICCRFRVRVAGSARRATRKRATLRRTTGGDRPRTRPTTLFHVDDPQDAAPVFSISSRAHQGTVPHRPPPPGRTSAPYARATRVHDGRHILRQRLRLIANAKQ